jgi:hypothetical protein
MDRKQERAIAWDCLTVVAPKLRHVDQREFEAAANQYTADADWSVDGAHCGRLADRLTTVEHHFQA